jgi:hypothetical protein
MWKEKCMRGFLLRRAALMAAAGLIGLSMATRVAADTVNAGWDLFQTETGTMFDGVAFSGVPLGTSFTFPATNPEGNPINPRNPNLGPTDTIIERTQNVTAAPGGSGTTPLVMDALQLVTTAPVAAGTFGPGTAAGNYYITLQSGVASTGTMTINFANPTPGAPPPTQPIGGTFTSTLDVNYDLRFGSLTGTIVATGSVTLTSTSPTAWSHYPAPSDVQIVNVNSFLNGNSHSNDFFLVSTLPPLTEKEPGAVHVVADAGSPLFVPEPSSLVSASISLIVGMMVFQRTSRSRTRAA